ncbi:MAG: bifunctional adenosylcobinamide kinase/adenosylcobinamide-phosphate guanylyltransferase [Bacteroidetes bacterium]|nr:bifunctional adenosylcobinamide kinase/adenosylcobinamide-phosphate guanylyltransferase [Bacteroidota bacterium]
MAALYFVLGGARSGKSAYAEGLADSLADSLAESLAESLADPAGGGNLFYLATAQIFDEEMAARIKLHQQRRGPQWQLIEAPIDLGPALAKADSPANVILIDCLSVWITNILIHEYDVDAARTTLMDQLARCEGTIIVVASETGLGIIPDNALSRRFRDANGHLNQAIARQADEVFFMTAGIATKVKPQK